MNIGGEKRKLINSYLRIKLTVIWIKVMSEYMITDRMYTWCITDMNEW